MSSVSFNVQYSVNPRSKRRSNDRVEILLTDLALNSSIMYKQPNDCVLSVGFLTPVLLFKWLLSPRGPPAYGFKYLRLFALLCDSLKCRYLFILPFKPQMFAKQLTSNVVQLASETAVESSKVKVMFSNAGFPSLSVWLKFNVISQFLRNAVLVYPRRGLFLVKPER